MRTRTQDLSCSCRTKWCPACHSTDILMIFLFILYVLSNWDVTTMEVVFLYGFSKLKYGQTSRAKTYACVARCTQHVLNQFESGSGFNLWVLQCPQPRFKSKIFFRNISANQDFQFASTKLSISPPKYTLLTPSPEQNEGRPSYIHILPPYPQSQQQLAVVLQPIYTKKFR